MDGAPRKSFCLEHVETSICRGTVRATCEFQLIKNRRQGVIVTTVGEHLPLRFDGIRKVPREELDEVWAQ